MRTYEEWCECCGADTPHTHERVVERWQDDSIDDCELSEVEMIRRVNGDVMTRCTCTVCGYTYDQL